MSSYEDTVRARFPSLQQDQIYLDNAGGSQPLGEAIDAIKNHLYSNNAQVGTTYDTGQRATARHEEAYQAAAKFMGANVDEIVFGSSTAQLIRNLSYSLNFKQGDEIVLSSMENEATIHPWLDLAERQHLAISWWKPYMLGSDGEKSPKLEVDGLRKVLKSRPRLVVFTHASDVLGTIHQLKPLIDEARYWGVLVFIDGVAYAPHRPVSVKEWGVDFYTISWDRIYGPHLATLYASWSAQTMMKSLGHSFNSSLTLRDKIGLDGDSYELCQAVIPIVEYLSKSIHYFNVREQTLQTTLIKFLKSHSRIIIYGLADGDASVRLPMVSFTVTRWDSRDFVEAIQSRTNIGISWGCFGSNRLVRETLGLGPSGVIRVSKAHYNTGDEIARLIAAIYEVLQGGRCTNKVYVPTIEDRLVQYGNSLN